MLSNEQENNKLFRNLPIQEILQERWSQNKQEQIRERVLDYMVPPSQASVSTSTICLGMRRNHKQDVDKLLRPISTMRWVKECGDLWRSEIGTLEVILLGLFCGKMSYSLHLLSSSSKFMLYYEMWCTWWLLWEVITIPACAVDRSGQKVQCAVDQLYLEVRK